MQEKDKITKVGTMDVMLRGGNFRYKCSLIFRDDRIFIQAPYNERLIAEFKAMSGAHWHGYDKEKPIKMWSVKNNTRNWFRFMYLMGEGNPYARYDLPLDSIIKEINESKKRPLMDHQVEMIAHFMIRRCCIAACEMGTGKTLSAIEAMERAGVPSSKILYVGPRAGVEAVGRELVKWKASIFPKMLTYDKLVSQCQLICESPPMAVIFDESSKIKTPTAQRSIAAFRLSETMREVHGDNCYIILMSGTPAPKTPVDWWHQTETARPGFLKEGDPNKFKQNLCITEERRSITGGVYPHLLAWLDDERKCSRCGKLPEAVEHTEASLAMGSGCKYLPSENKVAELYERMRGLVLVKYKKDCLTLPEKIYRVERIMPKPETLRMAQLITKSSTRVIEALTLIRELSDGFQYDNIEHGVIQCPTCRGVGECDVSTNVVVDTQAPLDITEADGPKERVTCDRCGGCGEVPKLERIAKYFGTPKDDYVINMLDELEDVGRVVIWAGFTGSLDKLVELCLSEGWFVLRVDGRGFHGFAPGDEKKPDSRILLDAMDASHPNKLALLEAYPKLAFVGHPQAGGMALTLTASPVALYYSNVFNGEARMQSEDRIHRAGMDANRAATIIDLIHLGTDQLVLDNIQKKKKLQALSMGQLHEVLK